MLVATEKLERKLEELGFIYIECRRGRKLWRRHRKRAFSPQHGYISTTAVTSILRQCGCAEDEIEAFIRSARS